MENITYSLQDVCECIDGDTVSHSNISRKTNRIIENLNIDIRQYKKGRTYEFSLEMTAFLISFNTENAYAKDSIIHKINDEELDSVSLDELWRFICKINAVCDILDRNGKDFPQIRQEINDIKGNAEKYLSDNNIQYYDIHRSREFNNFKMHFYIQNYSNIMLNKFKSQLDDFCSKIYKPNDTNVTFHSIDEAMTLIKENINYTDEYFLYNALCNLDKGMSQFFNLQSKYMDIFKELTSSTDENISNYIKRQPEEMVTIIESSLNEKCPMPNINEETSKEITEHIKKKFDELRIKKDLKEMFLNVLYELESTAFKKDFPVEVIEPKLVAFLKTIPLEELTDSREDANRDSGLDKNKKKVVISISAENYLVWQKFKKECCNV